MIDPVILSKIVGLSVTELVYPRIIFSLLLPVAANIICFYGLNEKLEIFGRGNLNRVISIVLALIFSYFTIKLMFLGYAVACIGISFLYVKDDVQRLVILIGLIGLYFWLQSVIV